MSLRLICGRSGTGKSEYCFNEMLERVNKEKKIYMITPEQYSYAAEKRLLDKSKNGAIINCEILTFARMAHRVSLEVGGSKKTNLSGCGKAMLLYSLLMENKDSLNFLGKSEQNIDIINTQITELKKHKISVEDLNNVKQNIDNKYLEAKLNDIIKIYSKLEEKIQNNYIDENDTLTILANQLKQTDMFNDTVIFIDEFTGFTKQELDIIKQLLNVAKQVNITICTDNLDMYTNQDTDLFYSNKITADKILYIARSSKVECEKTVFLEENKRLKTQELIHLEKNIFDAKYTAYESDVENIKLFLANNVYSEIENVAKQIVKLVKYDGYRYKDIAIITKNLDTYSSLAKVIFNKYNIPVFIDEKKSLSQNILVKYVLSILNIFANNWSYEAVFSYIKTNLLDLDDLDIYDLENYCLKWGIKSNKWFEKWDYEEVTDYNKENLEKIEMLRQQIVNPLLELKKNLSGTKTVEQITKNLYMFLIQNNVQQKLIHEDNLEITSEAKLAWNTIINVFDEMVMIFKDDKITFEKYSELLKIGLNNSGLGKIPQTQDEIIVGDVDRTKVHSVKVMFVIGMNDGVFPTLRKDEGFLNDKDRNILKENKIELAKTTVENLYEDNFSIYKVFTAPQNKIYLSYASSNLDGGTLRPSILITKIKKIFPNLKEESDIIKSSSEILTKQSTFEELIINLRKYIDGEKIDEIWFQVFYYYSQNEEYKYKLEEAIKAITKKNAPQKISKENLEKLYSNTLNTSISRLEQYKSCAFSYFLKYVLNLSEKNSFKVQPIDTGTFMHETIDEFFNIINEKNIKIENIDDKIIKQIVSEIIEEKLNMHKNYIFKSTKKYELLTARLKNVIEKSLKYIVESLKDSDFSIFGTEMEFEKGKDYEPIILELENGKKVEITGKIDRIDIGKNADGKYIRIIDYKSSAKSVELNEVYAGLQIQLITYLDAACKNEDVIPAGMLYYDLQDPIISGNSAMSAEQIEEEVRKKFKMNGYVLADVNVVKMMDKKLESGYSSKIPAYLGKDGIVMNKSKCLTKYQFEDLQKYIKKLIKEISNEILDGNISINPYYNMKNKKTPCEFCKYYMICGFKDNKDGSCSYNYIPRYEKQEVLDMIKEEHN